MRVVPRLNEEVNQEWISDKARFQYDALRYQRLDRPLLKGAKVRSRPPLVPRAHCSKPLGLAWASRGGRWAASCVALPACSRALRQSGRLRWRGAGTASRHPVARRSPPLNTPLPPPPPPPTPLGQGLEAASWPEAFAAIKEAAAATPGSSMRAVAGKLADAEAMVALKDLMNRLGCGDLRVRECERGGGGRVSAAGGRWGGGGGRRTPRPPKPSPCARACRARVGLPTWMLMRAAATC